MEPEQQLTSTAVLFQQTQAAMVTIETQGLTNGTRLMVKLWVHRILHIANILYIFFGISQVTMHNMCLRTYVFHM
jgi:hypothetical protein